MQEIFHGSGKSKFFRSIFSSQSRKFHQFVHAKRIGCLDLGGVRKHERSAVCDGCVVAAVGGVGRVVDHEVLLELVEHLDRLANGRDEEAEALEQRCLKAEQKYGQVAIEKEFLLKKCAELGIEP